MAAVLRKHVGKLQYYTQKKQGALFLVQTDSAGSIDNYLCYMLLLFYVLLCLHYINIIVFQLFKSAKSYTGRQ